MKKLLSTLFCVLFWTYGSSQERVSLGPKVIQIEFNSLKSSLSNTAVYYSDESRPNINSVGVLVDFFGINGNEKTYRIIETPVLSKEYSKDHPEFKSYTGLSTDGKTQVKISITPAGLTSVLIEAGKYYYVEKSRSGDVNEYELFDQSQINGDAACGFNEVPTKVDGKKLRNTIGVLNTNGAQLRNYRIAIACTGEFTAQNGGNVAGANAKINALLTLINARYETELSTTFTLVATNDNIVYTDAATDPFSPTGGSSASQSQSVFTNSLNTPSLMPYANYDIGQTLHYHDIPSLPAGALSASGQAGPTPCLDNSKSSSWTQYSEGTAGSATAAFITGIIIHEMGHQFSAWHTFNGSGSNCAPGTGQYDETAAYEPGSGNTIMSYNGICGSAYNLTGGKVDYFHARSLFQISSSLNGSAGSCITPTTNSGNNVPTANAGVDYTIPKSTPFVLTGTGSDTDTGDILSYTWDQYDQPVTNDQGALGTLTGVGGYNAINSTTAPLFRSTQSGTGERTFPALSFILNNSNAPANNEGEALSAVARDIDMRLVVRDNKVFGGAYDTDDVKITVADSGPFEVTTGNGATLWFVGTAPGITWNVNGTDAAPVSCANVKISTSIDGGATFTTLIASTPNDGTYPFVVPNSVTSQFRIKIEAVGNIFFDINNTDIQITDQPCAAEVSTISDVSSLSGIQGSTPLNLNLSSYGAAINAFSGEILASDAQANLVFRNGTACATANDPYLDTFPFEVLSTSTVTLSRTSGTLSSRALNLYNNPFDVNNQCVNWIAANRYLDNGSVFGNSDPVTALLNPGKYVLSVSGFSSSETGTYVITPSSGSLFSSIPAVGSPYDYTYVAVNTGNDQISLFSNTADLRTMQPGTFQVYGLSFAGGLDLSQYLNTTFTSFQAGITNGNICAKLSTNFKPVAVTACPSIPNAPSVSSVTVISGSTASLTASGCTGSYKWYAEAMGTNLLFMGNPYVTPTISQNTTYYVSCMETCESVRTSVTVSVFSYCSTPAMACNSGDVITNVKLTRGATDILDQASTNPCNTNGYTYYNSSAIDITQGESLSISVTKNTDFPGGIGVWIDFNRNGSFNDPGEFIFQVANNSIATQSIAFNVPANVVAGNTRMRVKLDYNANTSDPCLAQDTDPSGPFGEVEDYLLNIVAVINCQDLLTLASPTNDITTGTSTFESNNNASGSNPGLISATNKITGGNTTFSAGKKVELLQGFEVSGAATVFKAEIGGCAN